MIAADVPCHRAGTASLEGSFLDSYIINQAVVLCQSVLEHRRA